MQTDRSIAILSEMFPSTDLEIWFKGITSIIQ